MKTSYKQKLFIWFVILFSLFTLGIALLEQTREREQKTDALEERLDVYANMVNVALEKSPDSIQALDSLLVFFPPNIRLTWIDLQGNVLYDNTIKDIARMENHLQRPEIVTAQTKRTGVNIRTSVSNEQKYLYYAKRFDRYYVRVALPYDIRVRHFLQADNLFLYYIAALFVIILLLINYVTGRFGNSIRQLRDFALSVEKGEREAKPESYAFSKDELGEIGRKIAENYAQLKENKKDIALEREKLLQHVHSSEEGLCFFAFDKSVEFYNGLFIQYLNIIVDDADSNPAAVFTDAAFEKIAAFLDHRGTQENYFETQINKQGKNFAVRVNIFDDKSFEIIINDITHQEKTRLMKQEMTGNITHELRTPVTGIRGCLETILKHPLDPETERRFVINAYNQALMLSELIQDMSLITKIEEAPQSFRMEVIVMVDLLQQLKNDLEKALQEKDITLEWTIAPGVVVKGNRNLVYSIFRNLTDNAIRHAGSHIKVQISTYNEDKNFYYFSYSDTGPGIPDEHHLNRLFERFYRVDEGRTRDTGGSGLGLSIVKNAVVFHKGKITVKNHAGGGLEFLFKLPKNG